MTKDIILVPTHFRPEYLSRSLKALFASDGIEGKEVWVCQDERINEITRFREQAQGNADVLSKYLDKGLIRYITREPHRYFGNSYNLISSYRDAYESDARYVFLIEDDIVVSRDFFVWHERVQQRENVICSVAAKPSYYSMDEPSNDEGYFLRSALYCSWGVCWRREHLREVSQFPYHNVRMHGEQDCQIKEWITRNHYVIAGSYKPRAFHIGASGNQRLFTDGRDVDIPS